MSETKPLGFWILTTLVAGNMIGAGVFLLPASLAIYGSISILGWLLTTIGAIFLALVFASLSQKISAIGGPYAYCKNTLGRFWGFFVAYNYWMGMWVGSASVAIALNGYLQFFLPALADNPLYGFMISVAVIWSLTLINIMGVQVAGYFQLVFTVLKLLPLFIIIVLGIGQVEMHNLGDFNVSALSNFHAVIAAAALTLWSFIGLESASVPADKVHLPKKNIPRATIVGTLLASGIYILSVIVIFGTVSNAELVNSTAPYALSASNILGPIGSLSIAIIAVISCYGSLNGWILLQGQVPYAAALDNMFPKIFLSVDKQGTPIAGLIISSALTTLLLSMSLQMSLIAQFNLVISMAVFSTLIVYVLTTIAQLVMLKKDNIMEVGTKYITAIIALSYSIWMIYGLDNSDIVYGACLSLLAVPIYFLFIMKK